MKVKFIEAIKSESGAMPIVEAYFVFPITFFVIFFLFFMGNMYVTRSYMDNLVNEVAIEAAAQCADPNLTKIENASSVPKTNLKNQPYRYIFNSCVLNISSGENAVNNAIATGKNTLKSSEPSAMTFFSGMSPSLEECNIKFKNSVVSYSLVVTAKYTISLPMKFIFEDDIYIYEFTARAEVPVSDAPEFIRNIDMAMDYLERSETVANLQEKLSKIFDNNIIKKFG